MSIVKSLTKPNASRDNIRTSSLRLCYFLLLILTVATASFGGVEPFALPITLILCAFTAGLMAFGLLKGHFKLPRGIAVWAVCGLFASVIVWGFLQTVTAMPSSWHHPAWADLAGYLNSDVNGTISVHAFASRRELVWFCVYAFLFVSAFMLARSRNACARLIDGFLILQLVFGIFAVLVLAVPETSALYVYNKGYPSSFSSTFINRNSYAGLVGMGLSACAAALFTAVAGSPARVKGQSLRQWVSVQPRKGRVVSLAALALFLLLLLVGTQSKAGLGTSLLGVGLVVLIAAAKRMTWRSAGVGVAALIAVLFLVSNSDFIDRLQPGKLDASLELREEIRAVNWRMIADRPVLGTGLGTYADISPKFLEADDIQNKGLRTAHNTYQELIIELGLVGAVPLFILVGVLGIYALRPVEGRTKTLPLLMAGVTLQLALHSIVDFTLEIPANVVAVCLLGGAACGQRYYQTRATLRRPAST